VVDWPRAERAREVAERRGWVVLVGPAELKGLARASRPRGAVVAALVQAEEPDAVEGAVRAGADEAVTAQTLTSRLPALLSRAQERAAQFERIDALLRGLMVAHRRATLGDVTAALLHDVKDPLAVVSMNLDLIGRDLLSFGPDLQRIEVAQQRVDNAEDAVQRMSEIVREIGAYMEAERESDDTADPSQVVEQALLIVGGLLSTRARVLRSYGTRLRIAADPQRLVQILVGLLVHATHTLPDSEAATELTVRTSVEAGRVVIALHHRGIPTEPAAIERLFGPEGPSPDRASDGLWIPRQLALQLGGDLEVRDAGSGGMLCLVLPAAVSQEAGAPKILLVEDEALLRHTLIGGLPNDWTIVEAPDLTRARALLFEQAWDCVVCDVMLPEGTAETVYKDAVARDPELARKFVFVTAGAYTPDAQRFIDSVPNPVLDKPFRISQLRALVERVMSESGAAAPRGLRG
jgi:signal transduction histidine kinase